VLAAEEIVDISKVTTCCWYLGKLAKYPCIFYANGVKKGIFPDTYYSVRKCVSRGSKHLKLHMCKKTAYFLTQIIAYCTIPSHINTQIFWKNVEMEK